MSENKEFRHIWDMICKRGCYIDENGMLQLKKGICAGQQIPPHGKIFQEFAAYVEKTYGETGLYG